MPENGSVIVVDDVRADSWRPGMADDDTARGFADAHDTWKSAKTRQT